MTTASTTVVTTVVAFGLAAGLAAVVRAQLGRIGWQGTLLANVLGAFVLGWVLGSQPTESVATVIGIGFCGSLTTMSTFALEATDGPRSRSAVIIATTIAGGLVAVALGHAIA